MNRLTENKYPFLKIDASCSELCEIQTQKVDRTTDPCLSCLISKAMEKLAAYEDTGLEPHHIDDIVGQLLGYLDAEEQGLLIKLPCKVGDVVYLLGGKDYNKFRVGCVDWKSGMEYKGKNYQLYMEDSYYDKAYRNFSDIGKTVFLTREEAEKSLEVENE